MMRPRQISLRQITLHFSRTVIAPHTGQMIASESDDLSGILETEDFTVA